MRVLLDQVPDSVLLKGVIRFFLKVERDCGSSLQGVSSGILNNGVGVSTWLPDVLLVVVVLGGDEEGRVEPDTELSNQITELVGAAGLLESGKEVRLGDGTRVGDKVLCNM